MRQILSVLSVLAVASVGAAPAHSDPSGEWRVEDGRAHIRTVICADRLWGVVSWQREPGGTDAKNPDPTLRSRPVLGLPVVLGMRPAKPNRWEGSIYNAENGKTYQGAVTLKGPDLLEVEGCVLSGWVCSGQDWTRIKPAPAAVGAASAADLCLRLGIVARRPADGAQK
jgi:uncharacterized protein (DUF2147 family)